MLDPKALEAAYNAAFEVELKQLVTSAEHQRAQISAAITVYLEVAVSSGSVFMGSTSKDQKTFYPPPETATSE